MEVSAISKELMKQAIQNLEAEAQEDAAKNSQSVFQAGQNGDPDTPPSISLS